MADSRAGGRQAERLRSRCLFRGSAGAALTFGAAALVGLAEAGLGEAGAAIFFDFILGMWNLILELRTGSKNSKAAPCRRPKLWQKYPTAVKGRNSPLKQHTRTFQEIQKGREARYAAEIF